MTDFAALVAEAQKLIDAQAAADAAILAADAVADAAALKANELAIAALQASNAALQTQFDAYKASHPDPVVVEPPPPPPPPVEPPPVTSDFWEGIKAASGVPAGTVLTPYTGPQTITAAGAVIDGKTINRTLLIRAGNVTIKNCKITVNDNWGIDAEGAKNPTIQNCTITGPGKSGNGNSAILGAGTFLRNNCSLFSNGITLMNGASTAKGNYIHDLAAAGEPHNDGFSVQGGQNGVLIEDNVVLANDTSDIIICDDFGSVDNVRVNHNYLGGTPGINVYSVARHSADKGWHVKGVSITNNVIVKGFYDYFTIENSTTTLSGNVTPDGKPIAGA